jgi:hypothetical protein
MNNRFLKSQLDALSTLKSYEPFAVPVNPIELGIPDYPKIITNPMDLGFNILFVFFIVLLFYLFFFRTIREKIKSGEYNNYIDEALMDVALVWDNCYHFNEPGSYVSNNALILQKNLAKKLESSYN